MTIRSSEPPPPTAPAADEPRRLARLRPRFILHFPAVVFTLTTLLLPIGAINGQNNLLFWVFGLAVAALLCSGFLGAWMISSIVIEREPIEASHVGDIVRLRYRVTNASRWIPAFAIGVSEFPLRPRTFSAPRIDPTWPRRFTAGFAFAEFIPRGGTVTLVADVAAVHRGIATFDALEVWTGFPFGLSRKTYLHAREQTAIVRPRPLSIRPECTASLARSRSAHNAGAAPRTGSGDEFHSLREHSDGDPLRAIAWKRSATADRLYVRQNAQAINRRVWIGLADLRGLSTADAEDTIAAAAGLAAAATSAGHAVGILATSHRPAVPPRHGPRALANVFDALAAVDAGNDGTSIVPNDAGDALVVLLNPKVDAPAIASARTLSPAAICSEPLPGRTSRDSTTRAPDWKERLGSFIASALGVSSPPAAAAKPGVAA